MLHDACRERDAGHLTDAFRPEAGTIDENIAGDRPAIRHHADGPAVLDDNLLDRHPFLDLHAVHPRALGIGHGQGIGIDVAVAGYEGGTLDALLDDVRETVRCLFSGEGVAFDAEAFCLGHRTANFAPALRTSGKPERAHLLPGNVLARFLFQAIEDRDGILHQPGQIALAAKLADEACRMPGAAMGEHGLFDQQDIPRAVAGEVVGDGRADGPTADDEDVDVTIRAK